MPARCKRKLLEGGEGRGLGREKARKSIIYVLTEADQKVAGAADIRQIMMAVEQARYAGKVGGGRGRQTVEAECRRAAAQLATC